PPMPIYGLFPLGVTLLFATYTLLMTLFHCGWRFIYLRQLLVFHSCAQDRVCPARLAADARPRDHRCSGRLRALEQPSCRFGETGELRALAAGPVTLLNARLMCLVCCGHLRLSDGGGRQGVPLAMVVEARQYLAGVDLEEPLVVAPDLLDVELIETGVLIRLDRLQMSVEVGSARHGFGHHALADQLAGLLEMCRGRQDLRKLAGQLLAGPQPVYGGAGSRLVLAPANLHPAGYQHLVVLGLGPELVDRFLVWADRAEPVTDTRRERRCLWSEPGDQDRRYPLRQIVDAGVLHPVVPAAVALHPALPQVADHDHGLLEHLKTLVRRWPVVPEDVLVERLPGAEPEREAAL